MRLTVLILTLLPIFGPSVSAVRIFGLVEITRQKHVITHDQYLCGGQSCWCALIIG